MTSFARAHLLLETGDRIALWFNPSTLHRSRQAKYNRAKGTGQTAPTLAYLGTDAESLSIDVLLHAQDQTSGDEVEAAIAELEKLVEPTVEVGGKRPPRPARLQFVWGEYTSPVSVCQSVSTTIELFEADGTPLRAIVAIALRQAKPELGQQGQNPTTRATQRRRSHLVHFGDSLARIAYAHYRDPTRWRAIAAANDIDDPMRLPVGARITVPLELG